MSNKKPPFYSSIESNQSSDKLEEKNGVADMDDEKPLSLKLNGSGETVNNEEET